MTRNLHNTERRGSGWTDTGRIGDDNATMRLPSEFSVATVNTTTMMKNVAAVIALDADIILVQETLLSETEQKKMLKQLEREGWSAFSKPSERRRIDERSYKTTGGVAVLAKHNAPIRRIRGPKVLEDSGRYVHAGVAYGKGKVLHAISFYGDVRSEANTEELLKLTLREAAALGDVPVLIGGDFNMDTRESACIQLATSQGLWTDCAVAMNSAEPTCTGGLGLRRIDAVLLNNTAAAAITAESRTQTLSDTGIPTHKPVMVNHLRLKAYDGKTQHMPKPRQFDTEHLRPDVKLARKILKDSNRDWEKACVAKNTDSMLRIIGNDVEEYFLKKNDISDKERKKYLGRGKAQTPKNRSRAPKQAGTNGALDGWTVNNLRLLRILEELRRLTKDQEGPSVTPTTIEHLWKKAKKIDPTLPEEIPDREGITRQCNDLRREQTSSLTDIKHERVRMWKRRMVDCWYEDPGRIFRWVKDAHQTQTLLMQKEDGNWTANCGEMDAEMQNAWRDILQKYREDPQPDWESFRERYGKYIENHPMICEDISEKDVKEALSRTSSRKAAGTDGFRVSELKALPEIMLPRIAFFLNTVEEMGWPEAMLCALVSTIPKGAGTGPLEQRPITVTSALYRLWGAIRLKTDVMDWQEEWAHKGQTGFRKGKSTHDLSWKLALEVELATLSGKEIAGVTTDFKKCFDLVPHGILLSLVEAMGISDRILKPIRDVYDNLTRRFKFASGVGKPFKTTNGILQGCPLSVVLFNALCSILSKAIEQESGIKPESYADDLTLVGAREDLQKGVDIVAEYCTVTGQQLAPHKCNWFSNREENGHKIEMNGVTLEFSKHVDIVGSHIEMNGNTRRTGQGRITKELLERARRIKLLPLKYYKRAMIATAAVMTSALFGIELYQPDQKRLGQLKSTMAAAIFNRKVKGSKLSNTIGLSLLCKGHCVNPDTYITYNRLSMFVRMLNKFRERIIDTWRKAKESTRTRGPIGLVMESLRRMGWSWESPLEIKTPTKTFNMNELELGAWQHEIRESCRLIEWKKVTKQRVNLKGIESGIDRGETLQILKLEKGLPLERGVVRSIMMDDIFTNENAGGGDKTCKNCTEDGEEKVESLDHNFWICTSYDEIRSEFPDVMHVYTESWPPCLRLCGIKPLEMELPNGITGRMQLMLARIRLERDRRRCDRTARPTTTLKYAGDWSSEEMISYPNNLARYMPNYRAWPGCNTRETYLAIASYLNRIKWAARKDGNGITFLEMAVDFEICTGIRLKEATTSHTESTHPISMDKKSRTFANLLVKIDRIAKEMDGPDKRIYPDGNIKEVIKSLRPLDGPRIAGIDRRSTFLGGEESARKVEDLISDAHEKKDLYPEQPFGSNTFIEHPLGWEKKADIWRKTASEEPSPEWDARWTVMREQEDSVVAPEEATKRPPPLGKKPPPVCKLHRKGKCATCDNAVEVAIYECCYNHHRNDESDGLTPVWDFCTKHRMTACGSCYSQRKTADTCCGKYHHRCKQHDRPICQSCGRNANRSHRLASWCCSHKHHRQLPPKPAPKRKTKKEVKGQGTLLGLGFTKEKTGDVEGRREGKGLT